MRKEQLSHTLHYQNHYVNLLLSNCGEYIINAVVKKKEFAWNYHQISMWTFSLRSPGKAKKDLPWPKDIYFESLKNSAFIGTGFDWNFRLEICLIFLYKYEFSAGTIKARFPYPSLNDQLKIFKMRFFKNKYTFHI